MAHQIDQTTGIAACFTGSNTPAWHALGVTVAGLSTSEEVKKACPSIFYPVVKVPMAYQVNGEWKLAEDVEATIRGDTGSMLGTVGRGYRVFTNQEMFDFADAVVGEKLAAYDTAGALDGGRRAWCLMKLPGEYRAGKDDKVDGYVLFTTSHDGTLAFTGLPTSVRVVCNNTLTLALRNSKRSSTEGVKIYHSENLSNRIVEARNALGVVSKRFATFGEEIKLLASIKIANAETLKKYFETVCPAPQSKGASKAREAMLKQAEGIIPEKKLKELREKLEAETPENTVQYEKKMAALYSGFESKINNPAGAEHSFWSALNAITGYTDWERTTRGSSDEERAENRLNSIWFGSGSTLKSAAFAAALEMAQAV